MKRLVNRVLVKSFGRGSAEFLSKRDGTGTLRYAEIEVIANRVR